jgi:hypothetical protein
MYTICGTLETRTDVEINTYDAYDTQSYCGAVGFATLKSESS